MLQVTVNSSVFSNDLGLVGGDSDSRFVYRPGVSLAGCQMIQLAISFTQFLTTPVLVNTDNHRLFLLCDICLLKTVHRASKVNCASVIF